MQVTLRTPGLKIQLYKNIGRSTLSGTGANALPVSTRFSGQNQIVDLTPFMGEQGRVVITKSIREPSGTFQIDFTDQVIGSGDDLYGLLEPMDIIIISFAGDAYKYNAGLPIMMRGFVSRVHRSQSMTADRPSRRVTVTGHDYGKIWQICQVFYMPWIPSQNNLITSFPFFQRFGLSFGTMHAESFVQQIVAKVLNPFITLMSASANSGAGNPSLLQLGLDMQISDGTISPFGLTDGQGGTIYSLLAQYCDTGPWNELYIEDRPAGPFVVYRPNPFKTPDGKSFIMNTVTPPAEINISLNDVISMEVGRTDEDVGNYFWVDAPRYNLFYDFVAKGFTSQGSSQTFFKTNYGNCDPKLYGIKKMWEQTNQGGRGETNAGNGTTGTIHAQGSAYGLNWITGRRTDLIALNQDNVVFEKGTMRLKGNEAIKAGTYLLLQHGNMTSRYYVPSVTHTYEPFGLYTTNVTVERGSGFIDRVQQGSGKAAPYFAELLASQS
jgi:hypothetical protein